MVGTDQPVKQLRLLPVFHPFENKLRAEAFKRGLEGDAIEQLGPAEAIGIAGAPGCTKHGRQFDQALGLKLTEQVPASNLPKASVGLPPIPDFTQALGNVSATLLAFLSNQPSDLIQLPQADSTPSNNKFLFHGPAPYTPQT
jgi:hypothetical protein